MVSREDLESFLIRMDLEYEEVDEAYDIPLDE